LLDLAGAGHIVTIDVQTTSQVCAYYHAKMPHVPIEESRIRPGHPRITYLLGSSTDPGIVDAVRDMAHGLGTVMVICDSDHSLAHTRAELECYHALVTPGSYFIMEDTNLPGLGAEQAVEAFLREHAEFEPDRAMEKFLLTMNPAGYLRKRS
jgi:cephalosporin hydroxylase